MSIISTTDRVHSLIREEILDGRLAAGSLYSIYQLAERFEVSRTPVRDAVLRLADAGMLDIERNRGVRIRGLTAQDVRNVFELRILLEVPATAYAALNAPEQFTVELSRKEGLLNAAVASGDTAEYFRHDRELHRMIMEVNENPRLTEMVESLRDATQAQGLSTVDQSRNLPQIQGEHAPIMDAIRRRDAAEAALQMQVHLINTGRLLMNQVVARAPSGGAGSWAHPAVPELRVSPFSEFPAELLIPGAKSTGD